MRKRRIREGGPDNPAFPGGCSTPLRRAPLDGLGVLQPPSQRRCDRRGRKALVPLPPSTSRCGGKAAGPASPFPPFQQGQHHLTIGAGAGGYRLLRIWGTPLLPLLTACVVGSVRPVGKDAKRVEGRWEAKIEDLRWHREGLLDKRWADRPDPFAGRPRCLAGKAQGARAGAGHSHAGGGGDLLWGQTPLPAPGGLPARATGFVSWPRPFGAWGQSGSEGPRAGLRGTGEGGWRPQLSSGGRTLPRGVRAWRPPSPASPMPARRGWQTFGPWPPTGRPLPWPSLPAPCRSFPQGRLERMEVAG